MNVCTISVNINSPDYNYGAMLHSWAFQQFLLKNPNIEKVEIIDYITPYLQRYNFMWQIVSMARKHPFIALKTAMAYPTYVCRKNKFKAFVNEHITKTNIKYTQSSLNKADLSMYDAIMCESDVIWSPQLTRNVLTPVFLRVLTA